MRRFSSFITPKLLTPKVRRFSSFITPTLLTPRLPLRAARFSSQKKEISSAEKLSSKPEKLKLKDYGVPFVVWYFVVWGSSLGSIYTLLHLDLVSYSFLVSSLDRFLIHVDRHLLDRMNAQTKKFDLELPRLQPTLMPALGKLDPKLGKAAATLALSAPLEPLRLLFIALTIKRFAGTWKHCVRKMRR